MIPFPQSGCGRALRPLGGGGPKPPAEGDPSELGVLQPGARAARELCGSEGVPSGPERPLFGPELFLVPVRREQFGSDLFPFGLEFFPERAEREPFGPEF